MPHCPSVCPVHAFGHEFFWILSETHAYRFKGRFARSPSWVVRRCKNAEELTRPGDQAMPSIKSPHRTRPTMPRPDSEAREVRSWFSTVPCANHLHATRPVRCGTHASGTESRWQPAHGVACIVLLGNARSKMKGGDSRDVHSPRRLRSLSHSEFYQWQFNGNSKITTPLKHAKQSRCGPPSMQYVFSSIHKRASRRGEKMSFKKKKQRPAGQWIRFSVTHLLSLLEDKQSPAGQWIRFSVTHLFTKLHQ